MKDKIRKILNAKLLFFIALSLSIVGLFQVLANFLLINFFPIDLIEIDQFNEIPIAPFFIPLLFWNLPLILVFIARAIFKDKL